ADGSTTIDTKARAPDGSLANETITVTSADGTTRTVSVDVDGEAIVANQSPQRRYRPLQRPHARRRHRHGEQRVRAAGGGLSSGLPAIVARGGRMSVAQK
ncbi:hypothetical protein F1193_16875, partial [Blastochloris sulfoviridis]